MSRHAAIGRARRQRADEREFAERPGVARALPNHDTDSCATFGCPDCLVISNWGRAS